MNNEPVAWIDPYDLERLPHHDCWVNGQEHKNSVPLYTHPAKTLTDEEIIEITIRLFGSRRNDFFPEQWLDFARAILKKANFTCNGFCGEQECKENQDGCKRIKKASEK